MFRIKLIMAIAGGALVFFGGREFMVSSGASTKPTEVELASIEAANEIDNNHAKIGPHIALFLASVYEYSADKAAKGEPKPSAKVNHTYYPILSSEHPFMQALNRLDEEHGGLENVPENAKFPEVGNFAVLVKTKRFKKVGSIPDGMDMEESVTGLVINRISSLKKDEKRLIKQGFPQLKLDKVLILEEGRKPASLFKSVGMIFAGVVLVLAGVAWMFLGREG